MMMFVSRRYLPLIDVNLLAPCFDGLDHCLRIGLSQSARESLEFTPLDTFGRAL